MGIHKKCVRYGTLMLMCLSLLVGCEKKLNQNQKIASSYLSLQKTTDDKAVYTNELKDISYSEKIIITDDKPSQKIWVPLKQETTLSEVTAWLQQAGIYKGVIPKPQNLGKDELVSNGYIGPSILNISTSNNHKITIRPASYLDKNDNGFYSVHYIADVLVFNYDGHTTYIESNMLYNWLKNIYSFALRRHARH